MGGQEVRGRAPSEHVACLHAAAYERASPAADQNLAKGVGLDPQMHVYSSLHPSTNMPSNHSLLAGISPPSLVEGPRCIPVPRYQLLRGVEQRPLRHFSTKQPARVTSAGTMHLVGRS